MHAEGYNGKGVKIGMYVFLYLSSLSFFLSNFVSIDTGIDYNHPSLGGGFGAGHKVIGGYDFVGDAFNGSNTPVPDNDPLDECNGHGTHVAVSTFPSNPLFPLCCINATLLIPSGNHRSRSWKSIQHQWCSPISQPELVSCFWMQRICPRRRFVLTILLRILSSDTYYLIVLVSALLRAHQDNNDIITMSLGGVQGWSESNGDPA